ncbi:FHIPEP family type III secretion protein [Amycolatopsis sp. cg9]|uniref:FHIPEP family type III secretion protein n=1 Tax=Amycolatopsis sp. cg9 TaxID=3238801 RepID=UPI0035241D08
MTTRVEWQAWRGADVFRDTLTTPPAIRRAAADYAMALLAERRYEAAHDAITTALAERGAHPPRAVLLLMNAECAEHLGKPAAAATQVLEAVEDTPEALEAVASWLHALLLAEGAGPARKALLDRIVPALRHRVEPVAENILCALELEAAILEGNCEGALQAADRSADVGSVDGVLSAVRACDSDDPAVFHALIRVEKRLGRQQQALTDVSRVIDEGKVDHDPAAAVSLRELKAELLPPRDVEAVADAYFDAGEKAYQAEQLIDAERLLRLSLGAADRPLTRWYLAETLRLSSVGLLDRAERRGRLERALEQWRAGTEAGPTSWAWSWALDTSAAIHRELADVDPERSKPLMLAVLEAYERHLLDDDQDGDMWSRLAETFIELELAGVALGCAQQAVTLAPGDQFALWTLLYAQLQSGHPEAEATCRRFLDLPPDNVLMHGLARYLLGRYREAEEMLHGAYDGPEGLKARLIAIRALLRAEPEAAATTAAGAVELIDREDPRVEYAGIPVVAELLYRGGRYDEAIALLEPIDSHFDRTTYTAGDIAGTLMLCHLALDRPEVTEKQMATLRASLRDVFEASQLARELRDFARAAPSDAGAATALRHADEVDRLAGRLQTAHLDPEDVLRRLAEASVEDSRWPFALTRSRLLIAAARWEEAALISIDVLESAGLPDIDKPGLVGRVLVAIDALLENDEVDRAHDLVGRALSTPLPLPPDDCLTALECRRLLTSLLRGEESEARRAAVAAGAVPAHELADVLRKTGGGAARLVRFRRAASGLGELPLVEALDLVRDELFQLSPALGDWAWPMTDPIVVSIATDLVPADTSEEGPLFATTIPRIRDRVRAATGVTVPGIRIREDGELPPGSYRIRIGDQRAVPGHVPPGHAYVPSSGEHVRSKLGQEVEVSVVPDPLTGAEGCWVVAPPAGAEGTGHPGATALERAVGWVRDKVHHFFDQVVWSALLIETGGDHDRLTYPMRVLEARLLAGAADLVRIDDAAELISEWRTAGHLVDAPDLDERGVVRLTTVFRDLLHAGVSLRPDSDLDGLIRIVADEEWSYAAAAREARTQLPPIQRAGGGAA